MCLHLRKVSPLCLLAIFAQLLAYMTQRDAALPPASAEAAVARADAAGAVDCAQRVFTATLDKAAAEAQTLLQQHRLQQHQSGETTASISGAVMSDSADSDDTRPINASVVVTAGDRVRWDMLAADGGSAVASFYSLTGGVTDKLLPFTNANADLASTLPGSGTGIGAGALAWSAFALPSDSVIDILDAQSQRGLQPPSCKPSASGSMQSQAAGAAGAAAAAGGDTARSMAAVIVRAVCSRAWNFGADAHKAGDMRSAELLLVRAARLREVLVARVHGAAKGQWTGTFRKTHYMQLNRTFSIS